MSILRGLIGVIFLLGVAYLFSAKRKEINWRIVGAGILLQLVIAVLVIKVPPVYMAFRFISNCAVKVLDFTRVGSEFLFGSLVSDMDSFGHIFAFQVLPTIVFFSALTSLLYYFNILQWVVYGFAWLMKKAMQLSGAETLAAAANIFVGQTEAPLLVKPYIEKMTRSEILALMTGGMATIAGGVFVAYVGMLGGDDPVERLRFATHLLVASLLSAPAALVFAKMLLPETEDVNKDLFVPRHDAGSNMLDALAVGTTQGVKLAVNVGAMLLVFTALIALVNYVLHDGIGHYTGLNSLIEGWTDGRYEGFTLQYVLGLVLAPVAWLIGVPSGDLMTVGQLLGEKTILNEFYAYFTFGQLKAEGVIVHEKSVVIATYALCGFANFASIGIQIGGISAIAPGQRSTLSQLAVRSLVGGTLACLMTGCLVGMFF